MSTVRQNFAQYLKALQILYFALLAGSFIFIIVFYFLPQDKENLLPQDGLAIRIPILVFILLASAFFLGRNRIEAARNQNTLQEKMVAYRAAVIIRWALLEGSVLLASVFFFLSRNLLLLTVALIGWAVLAIFYPSRDRIITDLDLSTEEQSVLDDPDAIIAEIKGRGL